MALEVPVGKSPSGLRLRLRQRRHGRPRLLVAVPLLLVLVGYGGSDTMAKRRLGRSIPSYLSRRERGVPNCLRGGRGHVMGEVVWNVDSEEEKLFNSTPMHKTTLADGRQVFDDDTEMLGSEPDYERSSDKWPEYSTEEPTSHDYDPDLRGDPVKTPNAELQDQLNKWVAILEALNATTEKNSTRRDLCMDFSMSFVPADMPKSGVEHVASNLYHHPGLVTEYLIDIRRCATGQGVMELLDSHVLFAGFRFWELLSWKGEKSTWTAQLKERKQKFFSFQKGAWRHVKYDDLLRQGVREADGSLQPNPYWYHVDHVPNYNRSCLPPYGISEELLKKYPDHWKHWWDKGPDFDNETFELYKRQAWHRPMWTVGTKKPEYIIRGKVPPKKK